MRKLFQKKNKAPEEAASLPHGAKAATPPKEPRSLSMPLFAVVGFILSTLVITGAAAMVYLQLQQQAVNQAKQLREDAARRLAGELGGRIEMFGDLVASAAARPAVVAALANDDAAARAAQGEQLRQTLPDALRVRLLPPGVSEPDDSAVPPLDYACLELMHQAVAGKRVPPVEVHLFDTPKAHLAVVRVVKNAAGDVVGSVVASLDPAILQHWLAALPVGTGYLQLHQLGAGGGIILGSAGNQGLQNAGYSAEAPVPGTSMQLTYRVRHSGADGFTVVGLTSIYVAVVALLGVIFIAFSFIVRGMLLTDLIRLVTLFDEMWHGKRHYSVNVRLSETRKAVQGLDQRLQGVAGQVRSKGGPPPPPVPGTDIDVSENDEPMPEVMFMDRGGMSVEEMHGGNDPDEQTPGEKS